MIAQFYTKQQYYAIRPNNIQWNFNAIYRNTCGQSYIKNIMTCTRNLHILIAPSNKVDN